MDREELWTECGNRFLHFTGAPLREKFLRRLLQDEIQGEELAMPFHEKNLY